MSSLDDRAYFQRRARTELAIASTCEDNAAALVHFQLADAYERRVRTLGTRLMGSAASARPVAQG